MIQTSILFSRPEEGGKTSVGKCGISGVGHGHYRENGRVLLL